MNSLCAQIEADDARIFLTNDFADNEAVKGLGGRWNPDMRLWYIPAGRGWEEFEKWIPDEERVRRHLPARVIPPPEYGTW